MLDSPFDEEGAVFSPDGAWIAYSSDESQQPEVYLQPLAGPGTKITVSARGSQPRWRADDRELFYLAPDNTLMAVEILSAGSQLRAGTPRRERRRRERKVEPTKPASVPPIAASRVYRPMALSPPTHHTLNDAVQLGANAFHGLLNSAGNSHRLLKLATVPPWKGSVAFDALQLADPASEEAD